MKNISSVEASAYERLSKIHQGGKQTNEKLITELADCVGRHLLHKIFPEKKREQRSPICFLPLVSNTQFGLKITID